MLIVLKAFGQTACVYVCERDKVIIILELNLRWKLMIQQSEIKYLSLPSLPIEVFMLNYWIQQFVRMTLIARIRYVQMKKTEVDLRSLLASFAKSKEYTFFNTNLQ